MMKKIPVTLTPSAIDALSLLIALGMDRVAPMCDHTTAAAQDDAYDVIVDAVHEWHAALAPYAAIAPDATDWTGIVH